jgi:hypothetical protein
MLDELAEAPLVVTVENGYVNGGAGAYIADRLVERTGIHDAPPILRLGVPDTYIPQAKPDRILAELLTPSSAWTPPASTRPCARSSLAPDPVMGAQGAQVPFVGHREVL